MESVAQATQLEEIRSVGADIRRDVDEDDHRPWRKQLSVEQQPLDTRARFVDVRAQSRDDRHHTPGQRQP